MSATLPANGVLYIASGEKYIKAAIRSANTVRQTCPGLGTALYSNGQALGFNFARNPGPFDFHGEIENPHIRSKVDYLAKSPFGRTLYLDTDTAVVEDIGGLFDLLDRFDIALAHAMRRNFAPRLAKWRIDIPRSFPQFNGGVILYHNTPQVQSFFSQWSDAYRTAGFPQDQHTLRELLWLSDLRLAVLPPEYNVRYIKYARLWSQAEATPKILHLQKYHEFMPKIYLKNFLRGVLAFFRGIGLNTKKGRQHNHD